MLWWQRLFNSLLVITELTPSTATREMDVGRLLPTCEKMHWKLPIWCNTGCFTNEIMTSELKIWTPCPSPWWAGISAPLPRGWQMLMPHWGLLHIEIIPAMLLGKVLMHFVPISQKVLWLIFPNCNNPLIIHCGLHKYCTACLHVSLQTVYHFHSGESWWKMHGGLLDLW